MTTAPKTVSCPSCGGDSVYATSNPFRPFCSARCKNVDLGAWASESFRLAVNSNAEDQPLEEAPPSSASH
ncbi:MAG: DNA gyrase inhibitor YacG [Comamonadaceae bacterium]